MSAPDLETAKMLQPSYPYATREELERSSVDRERFYSEYRLDITPDEDAEFVSWLRG